MSEDERRSAMVNDIIDELDQESSTHKYSGVSSIALKQVDDLVPEIPEDAGFIKKFTDKQVQEEKNAEYQRSQMEDAISGKVGVWGSKPSKAEEEPHSKGIAERYADKLKEEAMDLSQTGAVVNAFDQAESIVSQVGQFDDSMDSEVSYLHTHGGLRMPEEY